MSTIIGTLPYELILKTICTLNDIRDVVSFSMSNQDINDIVIKNLNYIIDNLIINNSQSYPQMSLLISSCYKKHADYEHNSYIIRRICNFISSVPKETIIKELNDLNIFIKAQDEPHNSEIAPLSKTPGDIYKMYYHCRINKHFTHDESTYASIYLEWSQFVKMHFYLKMHKPMESMHIAQLNDEQVIKMNMIVMHDIDIFNAIRAVNELTDDGISKALEIFKRGVPINNAIDAVEELEDHEIDVMCQLINEGIEPTVAHYTSTYFEEHRNIMINLYNKNVDIDLIVDIIENSSDERINWFIIMIDNNIDEGFASNIVEDETMDDEKFNEFINLIKMDIDNKLARTIVEHFDNTDIIKFITIINFNVSTEIAYDVVDLFSDTQITEFLKLIGDGIDEDDAYDMIMLYNNNQRIMCSFLVKNNLSCDLVENYNDEQITTFLKLINEDGIDFNIAKSIIDGEPSAKRRR